MIEAFANHFSSHLGRHLFYWASTTFGSDTADSPESENGLNLKISNLINKFHAPLERGVQILDHLLTLEEEDFNEQWGSAYNHNYELDLASAAAAAAARPGGGRRDVENQEILNFNDHQERPYLIRRNSKFLKIESFLVVFLDFWFDLANDNINMLTLNNFAGL